MKKQKKQFLIFVIVLLVAVLTYIGLTVYNKKSEEKKAQEEADATIYLTDGITSEDVVSFSYDYDGTQLEFEYEDGVWYYAADHSINIDQDAVLNMLNTLTGSTADLVTESADDLSEFGLDQPVKTVTLHTAEQTVTVLGGDHNEVMGQYYAMREGTDAVYLVTVSVETTFDLGLDGLIVVEETTEDTEVVLEEATETLSESSTENVSEDATEEVADGSTEDVQENPTE